MEKYQVIARKFRPQTFAEVCGQEAIVKTLKNAISMQRTAHAYLFCGPHGTGKTSLARILAKALNCQEPQDNEPCNSCTSCREITSGSSLDVIEIDGASNRGIDDIRSLNETVSYATTSNYKLYIIDEVHMLTKEAFNALLKTLEEPPKNVKFFFATTEPHKVPATISSRCQRFDLHRIPLAQITAKLAQIAQSLEAKIEKESLELIGEKAEGSMRTAESILDQILCSNTGAIELDHVTQALGLLPQKILDALDEAYVCRDIATAFTLAETIFTSGIDHTHFIETLATHYRNHLKVHLGILSSKTPPPLTKDHCLEVLEYLTDLLAQKVPYTRLHIEMVLLHIIQSSQRVPIDTLIDQLKGMREMPKPPVEPITVEKKVELPPASEPKKVEPAPPPEPPKAQVKPPEPEPEKVEVVEAKKEESPGVNPAIRRENLLRFAQVELGGSLD
ncbi:MAG: DNA polymerase III subunit gamma/tau [Simkaniaceae bacterium]|nr:DNA polymerase III subunit gamma/tau [Simkaniaceae bacterium]